MSGTKTAERPLYIPADVWKIIEDYKGEFERAEVRDTLKYWKGMKEMETEHRREAVREVHDVIRILATRTKKQRKASASPLACAEERLQRCCSCACLVSDHAGLRCWDERRPAERPTHKHRRRCGLPHPICTECYAKHGCASCHTPPLKLPQTGHELCFECEVFAL